MPIDEDRTPGDSLHRLHALLLEVVRRRRGGDAHSAPVTVAEIYQEFAPYRNVRAALGLDMNADYEHTLLRLLAGEGGLARLEPATAREQLAQELESPNPNVSLYRRFAGCDVWLQPAASPATPSWVIEHLAEGNDYPGEQVAQEQGGREAEEPAWPVPPPAASRRPWAARIFAVAEDEPEPEDIPAAAPKEEPAALPAGASGAAAAVAATAAAGRCAFCDSALPRGRAVRFCPYCGADQTQRPCASCGEALEAGWAFCVACGAPVADASA